MHKLDIDKYHKPDIIEKFKENIQQENKKKETKVTEQESSSGEHVTGTDKEELMDVDVQKSNVSFSSQSREYLERRLKIEDEVTFVSRLFINIYYSPNVGRVLFYAHFSFVSQERNIF